MCVVLNIDSRSQKRYGTIFGGVVCVCQYVLQFIWQNIWLFDSARGSNGSNNCDGIVKACSSKHQHNMAMSSTSPNIIAISLAKHRRSRYTKTTKSIFPASPKMFTSFYIIHYNVIWKTFRASATHTKKTQNAMWVRFCLYYRVSRDLCIALIHFTHCQLPLFW